MSHLVTVKTNVSNLGAGNKGKDSVYHTKTGAENRNNCQLLSGNHGSHAGLQRGFYFLILQGKIAEGFIAH